MASGNGNTVWGRMVDGAGTAFKIVASTLAFVFTSYVLFHFCAGMYEGAYGEPFNLSGVASNMWNYASGAAQSAWGSVESFFSSLTSAGGSGHAAADWLKGQWENPIVKGGAAAVGVGVGFYAASSFASRIGRSNETSLPPLPQDGREMGPNELRLLKARLDAAQAARGHAMA